MTTECMFFLTTERFFFLTMDLPGFFIAFFDSQLDNGLIVQRQLSLSKPSLYICI